MKKIIIIGCITTLKIVFSEPQMPVIFDSITEYPPDSPDLEINGEVNSDEEFNSPYG